MLRESLILRSSTHPGHSMSINNLGNALLLRYDLTGSMNDLDDAISMYRESLLVDPTNHPDRSMPLHNLGTALL